MPSSDSHSEKVWSRYLLTATALNCLSQIGWFWRFHAHNINLDGMNYIGLARHTADGNFHASLHGYWSPLTPWAIAVFSVFTRNFTLAGRLVTIGSFLLCLPLLYVLALRLWQSKVAAALSVLWFSTARGIVSAAVGSIVADFVLTACALLYFVLLLEALRRNRPAIWLALGAAHALAFLAKAIAMPWLAISTVLAALMCNLRSPRRLAASLLLAFLFPAMVWAGWGSALKTKYGVFTSGYQLRANLMINWHRKLSHYSRTDSPTYLDTSSLYDAYMVGETSWSSLRSFNLRNPQLLPMIAETELQNIPHAIKETAILLSPAGVLALGLIVVLLMQRGKQFQVELAFTSITLLGTLCLVLAYCMLVFDGRYIIPVLPLLMAICSPMMLPASLAGTAPVALGWMQKTLLALLVASTAFFAVYWASPFRVVDRDFEISCYEAASVLKARQPSGTLVSIGEGPYPEHGVGFEAGSYVAYFAGWRLIGGNSALPNSSAEAGDLVSKVLASNSDAVVIWGSPADLLYEPIVKSIAKGAGDSVLSTLDDPHKGEVGRVLVRRR